MLNKTTKKFCSHFVLSLRTKYSSINLDFCVKITYYLINLTAACLRP